MLVQPLTTLLREPDPASISFTERGKDRRRAASQSRLIGQVAELHYLRILLADASEVVGAGWIQNGWFAYRDELGQQRLVGSHNLWQLTGHPITGACLVGAIVHAGGGPAAASTQPVHRALDLTWHALFHAESYPVGYCPAPTLRVARTRDLTRWNDRPRRRAEDVTALLSDADRLAAAELERLRLARTATEPAV
jgi:hypothetical protein